MKALSSLLVFLLVLSCASPKVVEIKNPLDEKKTCDELENSVAEAQKFKETHYMKRTILVATWQG